MCCINIQAVRYCFIHFMQSFNTDEFFFQYHRSQLLTEYLYITNELYLTNEDVEVLLSVVFRCIDAFPLRAYTGIQNILLHDRN